MAFGGLLAQGCSCGHIGFCELLPVLVAAALILGYTLAGDLFRKAKKRVGKMNVKNMVIIGAVVVAAAAIVLLKQGKKAEPAGAAAKTAVEASAPQGKALPRLVDLGAGKCIPCKAMKPILEDLMANYSETFKTEFIDVWENEAAKAQYKINLIPTQIFFDASGKEIYRHEGFYSKEDILGKWKEFGVGAE